jgi:hypothetical protein
MTFSFDDNARQLADDLVAAVAEYGALFRTATQIAASGASAGEISEWASDCFDEALSLRLLDADSISFVDDVPEDARVLVRELYESLVILSGVERPAHALSMPVSTCADGSSVSTLVRERSEVGRWYAKVSGRPFPQPDMPDALVPSRTRANPSPFGFGEGKQLAANADRELVEEERSRDLNDVFAGRLVDAIRLYGDAVGEVRNSPTGHDLQASLTVSARAVAPALLGFARLSDRRTVRLDPPPAAAPTARLVADGFMTLAAAETPEDIATLPYPGLDEIDDVARPLKNWLARLGTL